MIKLLWVDDDLYHDLRERRITLLMQDDFDSDFANDATDAYYKLIDPTNNYSHVILDLQYPSGPDDMWNDYRDRGERKYGTILLELIRKNEGGKFDHLKGAKFGVLSIQPEESNINLFEAPVYLPKGNYLVKKDALDDDTFLDFIKNLKPFSK